MLLEFNLCLNCWALGQLDFNSGLQSQLTLATYSKKRGLEIKVKFFIKKRQKVKEREREKNDKEGKSYSDPLRHFSWVYIQNRAVRKDCLNLFLVFKIPKNFTFGQCKGIKPTFISH